jgi:threonine/homoserine/homoserine lactone efflux protein
MRQALIAFFSMIVFWVFMFFIFAFIVWEYNPKLWTQDARLGLSVVAFIGGLFAGLGVWVLLDE